MSLWPALVLILSAPLAQGKVTAYEGQIELPTYPWWPAVRHPYFRGTDGRNIYPYPMLDNLSRTKEARTWRTVVLENEYLRVTFLPELGGKIYELLNKITGQPVFYVNHVVKPGLIGQCGAWVSGGIEFNTGPAGHTVSAVLPVDVAILPPGADGSRSVAVGEVERIYRTRWTVVVTLRPGRLFLEETIRIYNLTETIRPYYFWNCTAVPNTAGFRFVYPMTLGTDHGGSEFYTWPISKGKDLSLGTNYQDAASIFAYHCDQDFFGCYDEQAGRGVVAYANHHQLPGKKAWTWGQGSFGAMHQMDLTDTDGPYNEVQTGPLLTQAEVGRLDPCEAVAWQEWWYPVWDIGGFTFANRDLAAHTSIDQQKLNLQLLGTGSWDPVQIKVLAAGQLAATDRCKLSPRAPTRLELDLGTNAAPLNIELHAGKTLLAQFRFPLDLPVRQPPKDKDKPGSATALAQAAWQEFLFARFDKAESQFREALAKDAQSTSAQTGLAYLSLDGNPAQAATSAQAALAVDPDDGLARFALAVAEFRRGNEQASLENAWKAALDPATTVPGRALAAKLLLRQGDWNAAVAALSEPGSWQTDPVCRNRLALALLKTGEKKRAVQLASQNLTEDPLDALARSVLWQAKAEPKQLRLAALIEGNAQAVLDLAAEYDQLGQPETARQLLQLFYCDIPAEGPRNPLPFYWAAYLSHRLGNEEQAASCLKCARQQPGDSVFPHRLESVPVLLWAVETSPDDGQAALYLGHLLFALGRHAEGREMWRKAAGLNAAPTVALRALGMAALALDSDSKGAAEFLTKAQQLDPQDAIVARDLARVLFQLADRADSPERKNELWIRGRAALLAAFPAGQGRSDFVALLARAQNRLGDYAATARLLHSVRITVWEGAREAHDLFEEAHLALGEKHLAASQAAQALVEFDRALEYPENLATGRLENTREAHIHYLRGNALSALGRPQEAIAAWRKAADEPESKDARKEEARRKAKEALAKTSQP